jgi:hypothetical protein
MLSLVMFERRMNIRCKYSDMLQLNILSDPHFELFSSAAPPFVGTLDAGLGIISAKSFSSSPGSASLPLFSCRLHALSICNEDVVLKGRRGS